MGRVVAGYICVVHSADKILTGVVHSADRVFTVSA